MKRTHEKALGQDPIKSESDKDVVLVDAPSLSLTFPSPNRCEPELLGDDMWIYIMRFLDDGHHSIIKLAQTCKRMRDAASNNVLWTIQIYQTLAGVANPRVIFSLRKLMSWLDDIIGKMEGSNLCSFPRDTLGAGRDFILFKKEASDAARNDYLLYISNDAEALKKYPISPPNVIEAKLSIGPRDDKGSVIHDANRSNIICDHVAAIINDALNTVMEALLASQNVKKSEERHYRMAPMFPRFEGHTLWLTLFKLCYVDNLNTYCYSERCKHLEYLWGNIVEAQTKEIGALVSNGPYMEEVVSDVPTVWKRPDRNELERIKFNHPSCHVCKQPMPIPANAFVKRALKYANPFRRPGGPVFCSTSCLLNVLFDYHDTTSIPCSNRACGNPVTLRQALGISLDSVDHVSYAGSLFSLIHEPTSIRLDVLSKERRQDMVTKIEFVASQLTRFNREKKEYEQSALRVESNKRYIDHLPNTVVHYSKAQEAFHFNHDVWKSRLETFLLIRGKLSSLYIPWSHISNRLAAIDMFFPMSFLSIETPAILSTEKKTEGSSDSEPIVVDENDRDNIAHVFCSAACKCHYDSITKDPPSMIRCLNVDCRRTFNISHASLSMECFDLQRIDAQGVYQHQGYVCDYFCRDAYLDQRLELLLLAKRRRTALSATTQAGPPSPKKV